MFVRRQRTHVDPLIDLTLFRARRFLVPLVLYGFAIFVLFGMDLYLAQYLQLVLGLSPLVAGVWTVPSGVAFVVGSMAGAAAGAGRRSARC